MSYSRKQKKLLDEFWTLLKHRNNLFTYAFHGDGVHLLLWSKRGFTKLKKIENTTGPQLLFAYTVGMVKRRNEINSKFRELFNLNFCYLFQREVPDKELKEIQKYITERMKLHDTFQYIF